MSDIDASAGRKELREALFASKKLLIGVGPMWRPEVKSHSQEI